MRTIARAWCTALALSLSIAVPSAGQEDFAKTLVGRWEGEVQLLNIHGRRPPENRTLIIESLSQSEGRWVAQGRWGVTGKGLGKVQIEVDAGSGKPALHFTTGGNQTVHLEILDRTHLVGTLADAGAGGRGIRDHRSVTLGKVN